MPLEIKDATLAAMLERQRRERPDQVAVARVSGDGDVAPITFAELHARGRALAGYLQHDLGLTTGDRVALLLDNGSALEFFVSLAACWLGGFVDVPLNARLAPPELAYQVGHSGTKALVTAEHFRDAVAAFADDVPGLADVLVHGDASGWARPAVAFDDAVGAGRDLTLRPPVPEDPCDLLYTSGTTGQPKGALFAHAGCVAHGTLVSDGLRLDADARVMLSVPVFTSTGAHTFPLPCLTAGTTMYFETDFDPKAWAARARRAEPTVYFGVPAMLALILESTPPEALAQVTSVRSLMFGGSPMPRPLADRLVAAFPGVGLWNLYGLTEGGPGGTALQPEDALRKLDTVGYAMSDMGLRIVGPDNEVLGPGEEGEVCILTPTRMIGYLDNPEATARTIDAEGWIHTGDIGRLDDEGFLTLLDRKNDMIVRGGFNVYPAEVEASLMAHPDVLEAAVVGVEHPVLGEDVVAWVTLREGATTTGEELRAFGLERIADFKVPRRFFFTDVLPRNAMGKLLRRELRGRVPAGAPKG